MVLVKKSRKAAFYPKIFLAKVGDGKTILKYQKDQIVFSQGNVADGFLTKLPDDRLNRGFFSEIRQKQKDSRQPFLA